jgi:hypothetical protein
MALKKEDQWIAVAGLGAVAFGYWYYKSHQTASASDSTSSADTSSTDSGTPDIYIPSYDLAANNVVGSNQIYYGNQPTSVSGTPAQGIYSSPVLASNVSPAAAGGSSMRVTSTATSGQAMTMPVNM